MHPEAVQHHLRLEAQAKAVELQKRMEETFWVSYRGESELVTGEQLQKILNERREDYMVLPGSIPTEEVKEDDWKLASSFGFELPMPIERGAQQTSAYAQQVKENPTTTGPGLDGPEDNRSAYEIELETYPDSDLMVLAQKEGMECSAEAFDRGIAMDYLLRKAKIIT